MAIIKCKMCGGDLEVVAESRVAVCEYCGTQQTVPSADNEKKLTLFGRANRLRMACEFDKAAGVYESIVVDFPEEAEAYWGLVLCKYGIEYVDDPATGKKIPTCHRSSFDSVMDDSNLEQALENADAIARRVYRDEAKAIEELRKGIIEVSGKEAPYDIFICYKETDDSGDRTIDSVIAQEVYDALTEKGYRVFFSRITLEDKLGQEYEPYIFAALHSAKIMLAFGTDYEYYNAVWVKNEWSRFLQLIAAGEKKTLIPCYKNIDAYDMPKEFARLQAQDMGKVGAMQDLLRGIEKILGSKEPKAVAGKDTATAQVSQNNLTAPLIKRAFTLLEEGDWKAADACCERLLDFDSECAEAYLGKLMAKLHIKQPAELQNSAAAFEDNPYYIKAVQFAEEKGNNVLLAELKASAEAFRKKREQEDALIREKAEATVKRVKKVIPIVAPIIILVAVFLVILNTVIIPNKNAKVAEVVLAEVESGNFYDAVAMYLKNGADQDNVAFITEWRKQNGCNIAASYDHTIGIQADGTVRHAVKDMHVQQLVSGWTDIVSVAAGKSFSVGLKSNGTVVMASWGNSAQLDVSEWREIIAIAAGENHVVGLKSDGTVVAEGSNSKGECDVAGWSEIISISAGTHHTVGVKADGTVVAVGSNQYGQCNVSGWRGIVSLAAGSNHTVGLCEDGTVVAVGSNTHEECDVSNWTGVVAISAHRSRTVGLCGDGSVVFVGMRTYELLTDVTNSWTDIVAVSAGEAHTVGIKADGTVIAVGENDNYQCEIYYWTNMKV